MRQDAPTLHISASGPYAEYSSILRPRGLYLGADTVFGILTRGAGLAILAMLGILLGVLAWSAVPSFKKFGFSFLTTTEWRANEIQRPLKTPDGKLVMEDGEVVMQTLPPRFGALPVIYGTAVTSALALLFAVPLSLGAAIFLVRVAPRWRLAAPISFLIEFLAAIPSIAYGIWGLFVLVPFLHGHVEPAIHSVLGPLPGMGWLFRESVTIGGAAVHRPIAFSGRDVLAGSLVLAIMILPIVTAISRDVLRAVPRTQIEGTLALGATWWQSCREMLRYGRAGLFGAIMLGLARAAGETMAVTMVIGNSPRISSSIFLPAQTMASLLANEFAEATEELHMAALLEVALILLVMSLVFNVVARWLVVGRTARAAAAH